MRLKDLESALSQVTVFESPKAELEQYATSAHLAAHIAYTMQTYDDVEGKRICDLGSGTGMLSIAVALMGGGHITGFEIDQAALEQASMNIERMEIDTVDFCNVDIVKEEIVHKGMGKMFDVGVMNPPFGTKRRGVDIGFLQRAVEICGEAVYSLHKTSTREYIREKIRSWGGDGEVVAEVRFDIGRMYKFHKADSVDVEVDLWRFDVSGIREDLEFGPVDVADVGVEWRQQRRGGRKGMPRGRGRGRGRGRARDGGAGSTRR